jgi:hypothetical protein
MGTSWRCEAPLAYTQDGFAGYSAVWQKVEAILTEPTIIAGEVVRLRRAERTQLEHECRSWERSQHQLEDLEYWCRAQAANLQTVTYEQKRLALWALDVRVRVWATDHFPRHVITVSFDGLLPAGRASDLPTAGDADRVAARVDDYSRRGCARPAGRPAGPL